MEHNVLATPTVAKPIADHFLQCNKYGNDPILLKLGVTPNTKKNNNQEKS
jgi:hypothetical protein